MARGIKIADGIKLLISWPLKRERNYPRLLEWPNVITTDFKWGTGRLKSQNQTDGVLRKT